MIDNPFGLTKCRKLSLRRRTLTGRTVYYHTYFEPKGLDRHGRITAINGFKHPHDKESKQISDDMINYALKEFFKVHSMDEFDVIAGLPSSSRVVRKILNKLELSYPDKDIFHSLFYKTRMRNVYIDERMIMGESSLKTHELAPKALREGKYKNYDKVARVSLFPTRFRRYVSGFIKLNDLYRDWIIGGRVLLVDDTIGEGLTLCETSSILSPLVKSMIGFTVMKDIS